MSFEAIDWNFEAKRVESAFNIAQPCEFVVGESGMELRAAGTVFQRVWPVSFFDFTVCVWYSPNSKLFRCCRGEAATFEAVEIRFENDEMSDLVLTKAETDSHHINEYGENKYGETQFELVEYLSYALFDLELLTDKIEARLETALPDDEKALMLRDRGWKIELKLMDWKAESRRVAAAFGVKGQFEFGQSTENGKLYPGSGAKGNTQMGLELIVNYNPIYRYFLLRQLGTRTSANITLWPDGKIMDKPLGFDYNIQLAKGLYLLGLLTPEVETALRVNITLHEEMEWTL